MATILYVNPSGDISGAENSLLSLIEALGNRVRPLVACPSPGKLSQRCHEMNVPVFPIPFDNPKRSTLYSMFILRPIQNRRLISCLDEIVRTEKVDLIHANSYLVGLASSVAGNQAGIPVVWHIRDIRYGLKRIIIRRTVDCFPDRVLVVSQAVKEALGERTNGKVQVVYNGIRPRTITDDQQVWNRAELSIAPDEPLVGNAGILTRWKGQDLFLRMARSVLERIPNARFLMIGSAHPQSLGFDVALKKLVAKLGIQDRVIFTGFRQDALSLIASLDVYVHAAREPDPLPRAVLEAMSVGTPVVAPANGGIPEAIIDGESGLLYRTADVNEAASHVIKLLKCRDLSRKIGEAAKERIRCCFSMEKCAQAIWQVYAELLLQEVRGEAARLHELGWRV
ncbi:MAG TPA: glycosyltransferase family 4 protein [Armatimonadota bacterium]|nr:glycosyltransferase family 4 protein [Armatimonadota bacterium]